MSCNLETSTGPYTDFFTHAKAEDALVHMMGFLGPEEGLSCSLVCKFFGSAYSRAEVKYPYHRIRRETIEAGNEWGIASNGESVSTEKIKELQTVYLNKKHYYGILKNDRHILRLLFQNIGDLFTLEQKPMTEEDILPKEDKSPISPQPIVKLLDEKNNGFVCAINIKHITLGRFGVLVLSKKPKNYWRCSYYYYEEALKNKVICTFCSSQTGTQPMAFKELEILMTGGKHHNISQP